jgi:hypothetical protein
VVPLAVGMGLIFSSKKKLMPKTCATGERSLQTLTNSVLLSGDQPLWARLFPIVSAAVLERHIRLPCRTIKFNNPGKSIYTAPKSFGDSIYVSI